MEGAGAGESAEADALHAGAVAGAQIPMGKRASADAARHGKPAGDFGSGSASRAPHSVNVTPAALLPLQLAALEITRTAFSDPVGCLHGRQWVSAQAGMLLAGLLTSAQATALRSGVSAAATAAAAVEAESESEWETGGGNELRNNGIASKTGAVTAQAMKVRSSTGALGLMCHILAKQLASMTPASISVLPPAAVSTETPLFAMNVKKIRALQRWAPAGLSRAIDDVLQSIESVSASRGGGSKSAKARLLKAAAAATAGGFGPGSGSGAA